MNSTTRFSNRVREYLLARPHYPQAVADRLIELEVVHPGDTLVDVGSGTGFSSELFLRRDCTVVGVEPNREMREAGEAYLAAYPKFVSVDGTAEQTTLADSCADAVVAGQAFHWFDRVACRREFARIMKPQGHVILLWNDRREDGDPFSTAYEQLLLTHGTDYVAVRKKNVGANVDPNVWNDFFGHDQWQRFTVPNVQELDERGLEGRLCSSSYVPAEGEPGYDGMMAALHALFERHQTGGRVRILYDTICFVGRL